MPVTANEIRNATLVTPGLKATIDFSLFSKVDVNRFRLINFLSLVAETIFPARRVQDSCENYFTSPFLASKKAQKAVCRKKRQKAQKREILRVEAQYSFSSFFCAFCAFLRQRSSHGNVRHKIYTLFNTET
jgi:hypothetical protein